MAGAICQFEPFAVAAAALFGNVELGATGEVIGGFGRVFQEILGRTEVDNLTAVFTGAVVGVDQVI